LFEVEVLVTHCYATNATRFKLKCLFSRFSEAQLRNITHLFLTLIFTNYFEYPSDAQSLIFFSHCRFLDRQGSNGEPQSKQRALPYSRNLVYGVS